MNLKDDLLNFLRGKNEPIESATSNSEIKYPIHLTDGLCGVCDNRGHCVWVENEKLYCEHYE